MPPSTNCRHWRSKYGKGVPVTREISKTGKYIQVSLVFIFLGNAGAGTWILFENPIQYCYQYLGWKKTATKNLYSKDNDYVTITTVYNIGGKEFFNRFLAVLYKILRIDCWKEPVRAEIVITTASGGQ